MEVSEASVPASHRQPEAAGSHIQISSLKLSDSDLENIRLDFLSLAKHSDDFLRTP
jgi:hypothetical protein